MLIKGKCFADFRIYGNSWHKEAPVVAPGTTAHVGISLFGRESRSGHRHLDTRGAFTRNALDIFHIATDTSLGSVWKIRIWHDNKGTYSHARTKSLTCWCGNKYLVTVISRPLLRSVPSMAVTVRPGQRPANRKQLLLPGWGVAVSRQWENRWTGWDWGRGFR